LSGTARHTSPIFNNLQALATRADGDWVIMPCTNREGSKRQRTVRPRQALAQLTPALIFLSVGPHLDRDRVQNANPSSTAETLYYQNDTVLQFPHEHGSLTWS
jgi:hypothetical protein